MKRGLDFEEAEAALKRAAYKAMHGTPEERSGRFLPTKRRTARPAPRASTAPNTVKSNKFSPSRYYRQRRPHLFSDSPKTTEVALTREVLSHHLETLTNQKSEMVFEEFALRLAEKFIAPNLRPQTGPVGGGDGKTDSETYPVATGISERWFVPQTAAGHERWAFAFSAKRDWRGKLKSDVRAIVGTQRGYPRIYFVTNQFVPAKDSAKAQDELTKQYGVSITILDRSWLLDCVLERNSLDIAARTLGIGSQRTTTVLGPRDFERQTDLENLERLLSDGTQYQGVTHTLAADALRAAELARGLERPRYEVDGRYERAVRLARDHNLKSQELIAVYGWAWTSYFWFDDAIKLNELYDDVERLAVDSTNADELERLNNLLPLLGNAVAHNVLDRGAAKIDKRRAALAKALDRVRKDESRPNNALHAHSLRLLLKLSQIGLPEDTAQLDDVWREFSSIIDKAKGLGTFPFESIADVLTEVGEFVPESAAFDSLYEALTDALAARKSEGEAAKKNSERGYQKLKKDLPYDAIRWFGRAVGLLVKAEYEHELINALMGCSIAYLQTGLNWAARNYALAAATHDFTNFLRTGRLDNVSPAVLSQLFQCELALGRVPHILSAYELGAIVRNARSRTEDQRSFANKRRIEQGHRLAALLLSTNFDDLRRIAKLPDALGRLGLEQVRIVLLFLMGNEDVLRSEGSIPAQEPSAAIEELFVKWAAAAQDAGLIHPDYLLDDTVALKSRILGCQVIAICENNLTSLALGEALLGTLEALLATSLTLRTLPHLERLTIRIRAKADAPVTPLLVLVEENATTIAVVTHQTQIRHNARAEAEAFSRWLQESAMTLFITFAVPPDLDQWAQTVLGEENAFSRAITFSNVPNMLSVFYGNSERLSIGQWIEEGDVTYELKSSPSWTPKISTVPSRDVEDLKPADGQPPEGLFDPERLKHSDYKIVSPIDVRKWDAAKWCAVLFMTMPGSDIPPIMALTFEERDPAIAIFQEWRERFGEHDPDNRLRISILTGVKLSNPHAYAVIVGPNIKSIRGSQNIMFGFISRINIMAPKDSQNLDAFLSEYRRHNRFALTAAHLPDLAGTPEPMLDIVLGKYHLEVRPAWTVSENDPDNVALDLDDPPFIPVDVPNAPVLKALEQLARFRRKQG
ncbi:MAG: hypothetical protein JO084_14465 [Bradyrhizobiaceae bacterium]|nr:hypothetical protein [Bradyrhizobiaceae bacterium]